MYFVVYAYDAVSLFVAFYLTSKSAILISYFFLFWYELHGTFLAESLRQHRLLNAFFLLEACQSKFASSQHLQIATHTQLAPDAPLATAELNTTVWQKWKDMGKVKAKKDKKRQEIKMER